MEYPYKRSTPFTWASVNLTYCNFYIRKHELKKKNLFYRLLCIMLIAYYFCWQHIFLLKIQLFFSAIFFSFPSFSPSRQIRVFHLKVNANAYKRTHMSSSASSMHFYTFPSSFSSIFSSIFFLHISFWSREFRKTSCRLRKSYSIGIKVDDYENVLHTKKNS